MVLAGFWTYTCINWLLQPPYLHAWAEKYSGHGLVVIGVHTPEFWYLHQDSHPHYTLVDSFFHAALRGSRATHRPARQRHADTPGSVRAASTASRTG